MRSSTSTRSLRFYLIAISFISFSSATAQNNSDHISLSPSVIFEGGQQRYTTFGLDAAYTHSLSRKIGITGNAGGWFGTVNNTRITHTELMGGLSFFTAQKRQNSFTPYVLAGISNMHSKFSFGGTDFTNSATNFTAAFGAAYAIPVKNKFGFVLKADYNPVFGKGITDNNIRVGVGVNIGNNSNHGSGHTTSGGTPPRSDSGATAHHDYHTEMRDPCEESKVTKEVKVTFSKVPAVMKEIEDAFNKIPRVEAKLSVKATATAKSGEECCGKYEKPVGYLELKAGLEASSEINITVVGIPDIKIKANLWPVLLIFKVQAKMFVGPENKMNVEVIGKKYGALDDTTTQKNCVGCIYAAIKDEGFIRVGVKAGAEAEIYYWKPSVGGYDFSEEPDKFGVSAQATVGVGVGFNGTWAGIGQCNSPKPGVHGKFFLGKTKANLKFSLKLGIVSFEPSVEIPIYDGFECKIDL